MKLAMRDYLLLFINGKRFEIRGADVFLTLSDFLRHRRRLTGTKVVCAEGDCASCTVLVGRTVDGRRLSYSTVASCIQFLFQLDCAHVVTIEGLKYDGDLNPIQEAMVAEHGAQCGFCTPGFVVSLYSMLQSNEHLEECALRRGLTGNLCRCTGYEPILRAAQATNCSRLRPIDDLYPPQAILDDFSQRSSEAVEIKSDSWHFLKPTSIEHAVQFRAAHAGCAIVAGGTDYGVQFNKGMRAATAVLSTASLPGFHDHSVENGIWNIGGGVTLATLQSSAKTVLPQLADMLERFGSPQIRNAGTLAGNVANGSSIGDTLPLLFVLDAELELAGPTRLRSVRINEFFTGYRQNVMQSDELITRIRIPLPDPGHTLQLYKVSKRHDLDISSFTAAFYLRRREGSFIDIAIAYGGVAPTVIRLPRTEAAIRNQPYSYDTLAAAAQVARDEVAPISDVRGSADYRRLLAFNVILKLAADLGLDPDNGNGQPSHPMTGDDVAAHHDVTVTRDMEVTR